jgi:hypothetical protein
MSVGASYLYVGEPGRQVHRTVDCDGTVLLAE